MFVSRIEWGKLEWEGLDVLGSIGGADEGGCKQRGSRTRVTQTIWGLWLVDGNRVSLNDGIKKTEPCANRRLATAADDLTEEPVGFTRRVSDADPWGKLIAW